MRDEEEHNREGKRREVRKMGKRMGEGRKRKGNGKGRKGLEKRRKMGGRGRDGE